VTVISECEDVRLQLMVLADGEGSEGCHADGVEAHLQSCIECRRWAAGLKVLDVRFKHLSYLDDPVDLWPLMESRIVDGVAAPEFRLGRLSLIVMFALTLRTAQLLTDSPSQILDVGLAVATAGIALRLLPSSLFDIQISAPELQKRGA
jgi:predicted anti-sigma-YlaC factor YlaD